MEVLYWILGIVGFIVIVAIILNLRDILRYLRIRGM